MVLVRFKIPMSEDITATHTPLILMPSVSQMRTSTALVWHSAQDRTRFSRVAKNSVSSGLNLTSFRCTLVVLPIYQQYSDCLKLA